MGTLATRPVSSRACRPALPQAHAYGSLRPPLSRPLTVPICAHGFGGTAGAIRRDKAKISNTCSRKLIQAVQTLPRHLPDVPTTAPAAPASLQVRGTCSLPGLPWVPAVPLLSGAIHSLIQACFSWKPTWIAKPTGRNNDTIQVKLFKSSASIAGSSLITELSKHS